MDKEFVCIVGVLLLVAMAIGGLIYGCSTNLDIDQQRVDIERIRAEKCECE